MSTAQKRTWFEIAISLAGLMFSALSWYLFMLAGEKFYSPPWVYCIPLVNLFHVLCLTGFVLAAVKFKSKNFDERELAISHNAQIYGFIGVFVYLVFMVMVVFAKNIMAVMPIRLILLLIVSSFYFGVFVSSISFQLLYQTKLKTSLN